MAGETAAETTRKLQDIMAASPGVSEITVDGINVKMEDLLKQVSYWERRAAIEAGTISVSSSINLSGG